MERKGPHILVDTLFASVGSRYWVAFDYDPRLAAFVDVLSEAKFEFGANAHSGRWELFLYDQAYNYKCVSETVYASEDPGKNTTKLKDLCSRVISRGILGIRSMLACNTWDKRLDILRGKGIMANNIDWDAVVAYDPHVTPDIYAEPTSEDFDFEVGNIIRKTSGWSPMAVTCIKDGMIGAVYCGDYFDEDMIVATEHRNSKGFVLVVDPDKEFERCVNWRDRLSDEQHEQLRRQQKDYDPKTRKRKRKRSNAMKTKTELLNLAAHAAEDDVTTVSVYLSGSKGSPGLYTFLCKKDLAQSITVKDAVVLVETRHGVQLGVLKEVHNYIQIDDMNEYRLRWMFDVVNFEELKSLNEWQEEVAAALGEAQRKVTKRSVLAALGLDEEAMHALPSLGASKAPKDTIIE